jgi:sulfatase maturation enzyme AslB (radical SAM superfamily)
MRLKKYSNFCPVPWTQFASSTDGFQRTCCMISLDGEPDGAFIFKDGKKLSVSDGVNSYLDSDSISNLKKSFIENKQPNGCRCFFNEPINSGKSKRTSILNRINLIDDNSVEDFLSKTHDIDYYDIRLGNVCNLQCLMCTAGLSNQLYEQQAYKYKIPIDSENKNNKNYDWADDAFFQDLEKQIVNKLSSSNNLITFYFIGGEPLLNKPHFSFLQRMVNLGYAKNIILEYNTNLTVANLDILDLWNNFNKIILAISIDDMEDRYEYIRYPAKWNKIYNNLSEINQYVKQHKEVFKTTNVVPVRNILTCDGYSAFKSIIESEFNLTVNPLISADPGETIPTILTYEEKMIYLDAVSHDENFDNIEKYIMSFEYKQQDREMFYHMVKFWDSKRKIPFNKIFPLLSGILLN